MLKPQHTKMENARDAAVSNLVNWQKEVWAPGARLQMLCDDLDLHERSESSNCYLKVISHKVANAHSDITSSPTGQH